MCPNDEAVGYHGQNHLMFHTSLYFCSILKLRVCALSEHAVKEILVI